MKVVGHLFLQLAAHRSVFPLCFLNRNSKPNFNRTTILYRYIYIYMIIWYIYRLERWIVLHCYTEVTKVTYTGLLLATLVFAFANDVSCTPSKSAFEWRPLTSINQSDSDPEPRMSSPSDMKGASGKSYGGGCAIPWSRLAAGKGHGNWAQKNWNPSKIVTISNCFCPGKSFQCTLLSYMYYICKYMAI